MRTLVLDVNGTLSDMSPLADELESSGLPPGLAATWFAALLRDGLALSLQGAAPAFLTLAREELLALLSARSEAGLDVERVTDRVLLRLTGLGVHPDVPTGVRALAGAGHRLVALTNGSADSARDLLQRADVLDAFTDLLSVEGTGVWKPHPDAYLRAAEHLRLAPGDLTMVAAHPWDLDGASRRGLRTAHVDRAGAGSPASFARPELSVASLEELAQRLEAEARDR